MEAEGDIQKEKKTKLYELVMAGYDKDADIIITTTQVPENNWFEDLDVTSWDQRLNPQAFDGTSYERRTSAIHHKAIYDTVRSILDVNEQD